VSLGIPKYLAKVSLLSAAEVNRIRSRYVMDGPAQRRRTARSTTVHVVVVSR
jgi:hypothetical protein